MAYDALESARAKGSDLLMIDTAGRLQANTQLMGIVSERVCRKLIRLLRRSHSCWMRALAKMRLVRSISLMKPLIDGSGANQTRWQRKGWIFVSSGKTAQRVGPNSFTYLFCGLGEGILT